MFIRVPEAHSRSFAKAVSWRLVGSLDTFVISYLVTGKWTYAGLIISVETFTKILIYYAHEQLWSRLPWWRPQESPAPVAGASAGADASGQAPIRGLPVGP